MLELLFLLLPVAAVYGWYMGVNYVNKKQRDNINHISKEYVDGLNYLLSNEKDKAVNIFVDLLKTDSEAFEAHLALGSLFRSKGELDKAIAIHQSLLESASITADQRLLVMQQLAKDYMVSGIYDRSEEIFTQLVDEAPLKTYALTQLIVIYQATNEWQKAINIATILIKLGHSEYKKMMAQFYCELASFAIASDDLKKAYFLLEKSKQANPNCARTMLMFGRIHMTTKQYAKALSSLKSILIKDEVFIIEALPLIKICYEKTGLKSEYVRFLRKCTQTQNTNYAELLLAELLESKKGTDYAQAFLRRRLEKKPNLKGFNRLIEYQLSDADEGKAKESLILVKNMVGEKIKQSNQYCCEHCGFKVNSIYWLCPSCKRWETIKPTKELI